MKRSVLIPFALAICLVFADSSLVFAQAAKEDKTKAETATTAGATTPASAPSEQSTPLKIQILLTEFDGGKKVKSLPYTSYVNAWSNPNRLESTNIDCSASQSDAGSYRLRVVVERSWVDGSADLSGTGGQLPEPIIRQFKNDMEVRLRDGQTSEPTVATDSMTGKVMKVEVSLWVLKSL
jgi:hypothetical protein